MKKLKIALASFFAGILFAVMPIAALAQAPSETPKTEGKTPCKDVVPGGICTCYLAGEECENYLEGGSVCICAYTCICHG